MGLSDKERADKLAFYFRCQDLHKWVVTTDEEIANLTQAQHAALIAKLEALNDGMAKRGYSKPPHWTYSRGVHANLIGILKRERDLYAQRYQKDAA